MSQRFQDKQERDLFDQVSPGDKPAKRKAKIFFPDQKKSITVSYENLIFLLIVFIMSSIIFFSLGVEKGRQETKLQIPPKQISIQEDEDYDITIPEPVISEVEVKDIKKDIKGISGNYIIQLAAFKTTQPAEEQAKTLKYDRYTACIKRSGDYYQLYLDGFKNQEEAEKILNRLRTRYKDAYIRKL